MGVAIRDLISDYKTPVEWGELRGPAAVDGNNALYQFLTTIRQPDGTPLMDREGRVTSHLSGIFFRVISFLENDIKPVFVFDGAPPDFKSETLEVRRERKAVAETAYRQAVAVGDTASAFRHARAATKVDETIISGAKELLGYMGVPCIDAESEGEAQAAYMVMNGDVRYSISQDYDSLLFGAPRLVRNLTVSRKRKVRGRTITVSPEEILLSDVLEGKGITREELVEIGILVGTDFNSGVKGVGAKTALKIVKSGKFIEALGEKDPGFDPQPVKDFFLSPPVVTDYSLSWSHVDREGVISYLCSRHDFSEDRVNSVLERIGVKGGQKTLDSWF
ncbi:MAG: flap endonuclease-1 [Methanomicrobiaceae archaeon]|nr:flap endonuclease-1 [Methanomicrobiaceae archaeon]